MAARSIWKGYLRLSLVNCSVALYPAVTEANKVHFHKLNRKTPATACACAWWTRKPARKCRATSR